MIRGFPDDESLERLRFSEENTEYIWYSPTGEIVETTKSQTLTNKTLTSPTINSIPIIGEIVETTKSQTLTNKTLTSPTISDLNHTAQENIEIIVYP